MEEYNETTWTSWDNSCPQINHSPEATAWKEELHSPWIEHCFSRADDNRCVEAKSLTRWSGWTKSRSWGLSSWPNHIVYKTYNIKMNTCTNTDVHEHTCFQNLNPPSTWMLLEGLPKHAGQPKLLCICGHNPIVYLRTNIHETWRRLPVRGTTIWRRSNNLRLNCLEMTR